MSAPGRWAVKDAVIRPRRENHLTRVQRHVMLALVLRANAATAAIPDHDQPSVPDLAEEIDAADSTVRTALDDLAAAGWLTRTRPSRRRARHYELHVPVWLTESADDRRTESADHTRTDTASPPTTGALSPPTTGAESADHRRSGSTSSSRTTSLAAVSLQPDQLHALAARLGCSLDEATAVAGHVVTTHPAPVRSPGGFVASRPTADLRAALTHLRRRDDDRQAGDTRRACTACDPTGYLLDDGGVPVELDGRLVKCGHAS